MQHKALSQNIIAVPTNRGVHQPLFDFLETPFIFYYNITLMQLELIVDFYKGNNIFTVPRWSTLLISEFDKHQAIQYPVACR